METRISSVAKKNGTVEEGGGRPQLWSKAIGLKEWGELGVDAVRFRRGLSE